MRPTSASSSTAVHCDGLCAYNSHIENLTATILWAKIPSYATDTFLSIALLAQESTFHAAKAALMNYLFNNWSTLS